MCIIMIIIIIIRGIPEASEKHWFKDYKSLEHYFETILLKMTLNMDVLGNPGKCHFLAHMCYFEHFKMVFMKLW